MPDSRRAWWPAADGSYSPRCQCPIATNDSLPLPGLGPESDALLWLGDDDPGVREAAVVALSRRWRSTPAWLRSPAAERAALQDSSVIEMLRTLTQDPDVRVALAAERAMRGEEAWEEPLPRRDISSVEDLHDGGLGDRLAAGRWAYGILWAEARRHDPDEVEQRESASRRLRKQFETAYWWSDEERRRAIDERDTSDAAFRDGPGTAALAMAEAVLKQLLADPACVVRTGVLRESGPDMGRAPLPGLIEELEKLSDDPCADARRWRALALAACPSSGLRVEAAFELLRSSDPSDRRRLAGVAPPEVATMLLRDHDPQVRRAAVQRRSKEPAEAPMRWREGMDVVPDLELDAAALVANFDSLWSQVLPPSVRERRSPSGSWDGWPQQWRTDADLGGPAIVEPWLLDLVGHPATSPTLRFRVLDEVLRDFDGTPRYDVLLGTAGSALAAEAVDAPWFSDVAEPWLRLVAALPARDRRDYPETVIGDAHIAIRLCWSPPRALPPSEHVDFWRRSGGILWRASFGVPDGTGPLTDPLWRSRLTSLGLAAQVALEEGAVPDDLRAEVGRVALYAPEEALAVMCDVPRWRRPGDPG
jgi:hypothetical protein